MERYDARGHTGEMLEIHAEQEQRKFSIVNDMHT